MHLSSLWFSSVLPFCFVAVVVVVVVVVVAVVVAVAVAIAVAVAHIKNIKENEQNYNTACKSIDQNTVEANIKYCFPSKM